MEQIAFLAWKELCLTNVFLIFNVCTFVERLQKTIKIEVSSVEIEERGVKLRLTVVDTPGFADALNNDDR